MLREWANPLPGRIALDFLQNFLRPFPRDLLLGCLLIIFECFLVLALQLKMRPKISIDRIKHRLQFPRFFKLLKSLVVPPQ